MRALLASSAWAAFAIVAVAMSIALRVLARVAERRLDQRIRAARVEVGLPPDPPARALRSLERDAMDEAPDTSDTG